MESGKDILFSVIIPVYNTADYIEDAILSIVHQTLDFTENIQIVLVNDGSTDASGAICQYYAHKYPENIFYYEQENQGVAAAMNAGFLHAKGRYINFFGSDDKWGSSTFLVFKEFIEENPNIKLISSRVSYFGTKTGNHPLNYKYYETRVVDLDEEPNCVQLMLGNCVIEKEYLNTVKAKEGMQYAEDALLVNELLLKEKKYGVIKEGCYYYRRRGQDTLAFTAVKNKIRYTETPYACFKHLFDLSKKMYGEVLPFIQYTVMYEMQWRFDEKLPDSMTEEERKDYRDIMHELINEISDDCIYKQKNLQPYVRPYVYKFKHDDPDLFKKVVFKRGVAKHDGQKLYGAKGGSQNILFSMKIKNKKLLIEGLTYLSALGLRFQIAARDQKGATYKAKLSPFPVYNVYSFTGELICDAKLFSLELPIYDKASYEFLAKFENSKYMKIRPRFGIFAKITDKIKNSYWNSSGFIFKYEDEKLTMDRYTKALHLACERKYFREVKKTATSEMIRKIRKKEFRAQLLGTKRKETWIISDRLHKGGDNAENFFKYAVTRPESKDKDLFFVLSPDAEDYSRVKEYGRILDPDSEEYYRVFLSADKIISSHADAAVINPFRGGGYAVADYLGADYVYLQHGITPGNLSRWLNKFNKNIRLFITSSPREYKSILEGDYGYTEREVKLTGMARYDALGTGKTEKTIVFLPTWRESLAGAIGTSGRERGRNEAFRNTEYCIFYNELINNKRLTDALKENGYKGEFYVHPSFENQIEDFHGNEVIRVGDALADYESILNKAALMVTDYSSVAFDFAYQRKPIIYSQFDSTSFEESHFYERGYFNYKTDGFGPVTSTLDETVDAIIACVEKDCELENIYRNRMEEFFAFDDRNNSERIYNEIIKI